MDAIKNQLEVYVQEKNIKLIKELVEDIHSVDIASSFDGLSTYEMLFILRVVDTKKSAEIFSYLEGDIQELIITAFTNQETETLINSLFSDDIVELVDEMPVNIQKKILKSVSKDRRGMINTLLKYADGTAGSIMSTEYIELKINDTCDSAIQKIKKQFDGVESIDYCYVTDRGLNLVGGVDLKDIVISKGDTKIEDIMDANQVFVMSNDDQETVVEIIRKYDVTVLPVVNAENKMIGIITIDDIIDVLDEETTEDIHRMNAIVPIDEPYKKISIWTMYKKTITWLLVLMVTATLTQGVMSIYEDTLNALSLAIFIPLLMDTGGNAGGQSASIVIRALVLNEITPREYLIVIKKEVGTALLLGVSLATLNFVRMWILPSIQQDIMTLFVVSLTLVFTIIIAKMVGGVLPLIAQSLNQDPAVMAGPLITTLVDALALLVFFNLANLFLT